ncbi:hypothetical protein O181_022865 [Austropuccinia psidii MF-1]|uniref:Transcription factor CBF/NF-Y/archaeal histone domain-containing protein n=1 Tax=Austropuccinia psidii MF-1 TaxID=1389203 RepID=A0A9Q3CI86_9BASI|nr:hypothetical protein [Austropuccinia psidii MF-1]
MATNKFPKSQTNSSSHLISLNKIKKILKQDEALHPKNKKISIEFSFLILIATEFFIKKLTQDSFQQSKNQKRVFVKFTDIVNAIKQNPEYVWLEEVITPNMFANNNNQTQIITTATENQTLSTVIVDSVQMEIDQNEETQDGNNEDENKSIDFIISINLSWALSFFPVITFKWTRLSTINKRRPESHI